MDFTFTVHTNSSAVSTQQTFVRLIFCQIVNSFCSLADASISEVNRRAVDSTSGKDYAFTARCERLAYPYCVRLRHKSIYVNIKIVLCLA